MQSAAGARDHAADPLVAAVHDYLRACGVVDATQLQVLGVRILAHLPTIGRISNEGLREVAVRSTLSVLDEWLAETLAYANRGDVDVIAARNVVLSGVVPGWTVAWAEHQPAVAAAICSALLPPVPPAAPLRMPKQAILERTAPSASRPATK